MWSRKKWILFDCGQTLLDFCPSMGEVVQRRLLAEGFRLTADQAQQVEPLMWLHSDRIQRTRGTRTSVAETWSFWNAVYEGIAGDLGLPDPTVRAAGLTEAFTSPEAWRPFPDVPAALERLCRLGVRMGVVSNWSVGLHDILKGLDLYSYFDFVVTSAEAGVEKPEPDIFVPALEAAGAAARDCLYVGDSVSHDLPSATAAGLEFALIDRSGRHPGAPCQRIHSLNELAALVEKAG